MIVYLGIGSNVNPKQNIQQAKTALLESFEQVRFSRVFRSEAVGFDGDDFLNLVAEIHTDLSLESLIDDLKRMEKALGRIRGTEKFAARSIDIDILLFGEHVCQQPIILPRDEIRDNAYVLWPLSELAPDMREPGGNQTYSAMWDAFDKSQQSILPVEVSPN